MTLVSNLYLKKLHYNSVISVPMGLLEVTSEEVAAWTGGTSGIRPAHLAWSRAWTKPSPGFRIEHGISAK